MDIKTINKADAFPIGKQLQINFQECDTANFVGDVFNYLQKHNFNSKVSRTLVFVRSRKKAELYAGEFNTLSKEWKATHFHAGISADERQSVYDDYESGVKSILFATKAFGMGMDIPNIHFLFHLQPSSTFEDFLQEVGRAGRNKVAYEAVGFGETSPIQTICLYDKDDFSKIKDLIHGSLINWDELVKSQEIINNYYKQFQNLNPNNEEAVAINDELFRQDANFANYRDISTRFRMYLYWLEKCGKFRVGYYVPSHLVFDNDKFQEIEIIDDKQRKLVQYLLKIKNEKFEGKTKSFIEINGLKKALDVSQKDLFSLIIKADKKKHLKWLLLKNIQLTNNTKKREQVIKKKGKINLPTIEYFFEVIKNILEDIPKKNGRLSLSGDEKDRLINTVDVCNYFNERNLLWLHNSKDLKEAVKKEIEKATKQRLKHLWWFIGIVPNIKQRTILDIDTGAVNYNITATKSINFDWIKQFRNDVLQLLQYIYTKNIAEGDLFDIPTLAGLNFLRTQTIDYLSSLLIFLKRLGFIKLDGGLMPISIECYLKNAKLLNQEENENDKELAKEFEKTQNLKILRLVVLQAFAKITDRTTQENYIKSYFDCKNETDIISLLVEYPEYIDKTIIEQYQGEALTKASGGLNKKQLEVYEASFNEHLSIIAGPGSGKTHTLVLRIARLIHEQKVDASEILVLAFNRSVVLELKERIRALFYELGYSNLTRRLKVFTFHGLVKYCLREELKDIKPEKWTTLFNESLKEQKGLIRSRLGTIKYIFIDEFQDINNERLEQIQSLVIPNLTKITAIGDPNQSIYGFDRIRNDSPLAPQEYYDSFHNLYQPNCLSLNLNYRSFSEIITTAEELLSHQNTPFYLENLTIPLLEMQKGTSVNSVELYDSTTAIKWNKRLLQLYDNGFSEIAIMCRTNEEVYRIFGTIKNEIPDDYEIRIQGESGDIFRSREFELFIENITKYASYPLQNDFLQLFIKQKNFITKKYPHYYLFYLDILHALYFEFNKVKEKDSTYQDLYDFIQQFTQKDDGQLYHLYERTKSELGFKNVKRIILTTIHRVKGLEYQVVMLLPSYAELPYMQEEGISSDDYYDEELRLLYVAYSRAKEKLIIYEWKREYALKNNEPFKPSIKGLKYPVKNGIEKITFYSVANESIQEFYRTLSLHINVEMRKHTRWNTWYVFINSEKAGKISSNWIEEQFAIRDAEELKCLKGFYLSGFIKYTYQEAYEYDTRKGTEYRLRWDDFCKNKGWILIPDFAGYGQPE